MKYMSSESYVKDVLLVFVVELHSELVQTEVGFQCVLYCLSLGVSRGLPAKRLLLIVECLNLK